jgi:poly-gamma-glutamate synthesis protein (capsule biosynthesis protein)
VRLRIAAAGDIGAVGRVRERARSTGYAPLLAALAEPFAAADAALVNLEFPVMAGARPAAAALRQAHEEALLPALAAAGVSAVSLANNHVMDAGAAGLAQTIEALDRAGLGHFGAGRDLDEARRPWRTERRGVRLLVLGYGETAGAKADPAAPCIAPLDPDLVRADLARWRAEAEVLVVAAHWGSMYVDYPPPRVMEMARVIAAAGADVVLGHHPHVLQGVRREGPCLVCFSLGDAVFDSRSGDYEAQVAKETRKQSAVFLIEAGAPPGLDVTPLVLDPDGVPVPANAGTAAAIVARLERISAGLNEAAARFADTSAPLLLRYELQSVVTLMRQGRFDRVVKLLASVRPRHLPLLWQAVRRMGRSA